MTSRKRVHTSSESQKPEQTRAKRPNEPAFNSPDVEQPYSAKGGSEVSNGLTSKLVGQTIFNRYIIIERIGGSGKSTVYKAYDNIDEREVAVKVTSLAEVRDFKVFESLKREADTIRTLNHPGIPKCIDFILDQENTTQYLVTELAEGANLVDYRKNGGRLTNEQIKSIMTQLFDILDYLHSLNPLVIHRDVHPDNIIIAIEDGQSVVKLLDFGFSTHDASTGTTYFAINHPGFTPIEILSHREATRASDLYSLAVTYLWLRTSKTADDVCDSGYRVTELPKDLTRKEKKLLKVALRMDFTRRYQSVEDMRKAFGKIKLNLTRQEEDKKGFEKQVQTAIIQYSDLEEKLEVLETRETGLKKFYHPLWLFALLDVIDNKNLKQSEKIKEGGIIENAMELVYGASIAVPHIALGVLAGNYIYGYLSAGIYGGIGAVFGGLATAAASWFGSYHMSWKIAEMTGEVTKFEKFLAALPIIWPAIVLLGLPASIASLSTWAALKPVQKILALQQKRVEENLSLLSADVASLLESDKHISPEERAALEAIITRQEQQLLPPKTT
ncbi:protein kinase [Candidatus Micrarchaeota archaeon]|nr:protein kinase [Candidatus Micrarchaeota archaeon]MBU1166095.1 protein kinase [Candidatus Micrarchaeota archaeon]MBU1887168.1 protein kinase [Candidatus Micrarchaeota archaeon]